MHAWNANHLEQHRQYQKKWRKENPEKAHALDVRKRNTPTKRLKAIMRTHLWKSLRGAKFYRHWEELVGYSIDSLKKHIEKQFKPGMSWDNRGTEWEIDHKVPIAVFNFEKPEDIDFKLCWSLSNLQPLWTTENRRKGARISKPFQPSLTMEIS
jgi:hypothetical protein